MNIKNKSGCKNLITRVAVYIIFGIIYRTTRSRDQILRRMFMNNNIKKNINLTKQRRIEPWILVICITILAIGLISTMLYCGHLKNEISDLKQFNNTFVFVKKGTMVSGNYICIKYTKDEKKCEVYCRDRTLILGRDAYIKTTLSHDILKIYNSEPSTIHSSKP